jgi:hypothetical protein
MDFIAYSSKDALFFDGGKEFTIVGKGSVHISFGGKIFSLMCTMFEAWSLVYSQSVLPEAPPPPPPLLRPRKLALSEFA